ncbi:MAG: hypothetical protein WD960_09530 [Gemmatimonadota bacterium]
MSATGAGSGSTRGRRVRTVTALEVGIRLGWGGAILGAPTAIGVAGPGAPPEEEAVQTLFDAMEVRGGRAAATVMELRGHFFRVSLPFQGLPDPTPLGSFAESLDQPGPHLLERMANPTVLIHERIAVAWTPYDFHIDGEFSHCGVNAFTLVRTDEGWIINGITYTVDCPDSLPAL